MNWRRWIEKAYFYTKRLWLINNYLESLKIVYYLFGYTVIVIGALARTRGERFFEENKPRQGPGMRPPCPLLFVSQPIGLRIGSADRGRLGVSASEAFCGTGTLSSV